MRSWNKRPKEVANLLNPAFCSLILASSINGYTNFNERGMPFPVSFMILPIILHKYSRNLIPGSSRTSLAAWLQKNPSVKFSYYERVISIKPFTKEALLFGYEYDLIEFRDEGKLYSLFTENKINTISRNANQDVKECLQRSKTIGKMFSKSGSTNTLMALWGIKP